MSEKEPKAPYIYQPFGIQDKENWACGRIYAIGGTHIRCNIDGLTKDEAQRILAALVAESGVGDALQGDVPHQVTIPKDVSLKLLPEGDAVEDQKCGICQRRISYHAARKSWFHAEAPYYDHEAEPLPEGTATPDCCQGAAPAHEDVGRIREEI